MMPTDQVYPHQPVLNREVLAYLKPEDGGKYADATLGAGGHSESILLASSPTGKLISFDLDITAVDIAKERLSRFGDRIQIENSSYLDLGTTLQTNQWESIDGIVFDLGVSSMQIDTADRGFSFQKNGPLDMRFGDAVEQTAADIINTYGEKEIAKILWEYGEEPKANAIAKAIIASRPLETTNQFAELILDVYHGKRGKIHPATRSFQALRIAVNDELRTVQAGIELAIQHLSIGGRIVVISFHSLEDRIVKNLFRREASDCICPPEQLVCTCGHTASIKILTKKPVTADEVEIEENVRARSAKLRAAEKIA